MFFFDWIQLTALCYLISALLSPPNLFGSSVMPWWSWGVFVFLDFLLNSFLSRRQWSVFTWAAANGVFFILFGLGALGILQQYLSGAFWPNSLMSILVAFMVQLSISYTCFKPLTEKLRIELWELGIILSSAAAMLVSYYRLYIPYAAAVPLLIIGAGLFRQGLSPRMESSEVTRNSQTNRIYLGMVLILLIFGIAILSLVSLVSDNSIGQALNAAIASIIDFYNRLGPDTIDKAAKAIPFMDLDYAKLMETSSSPGVQAPFWFMLLLWIILAVSVILTIIVLLLYGILKLKEFKQSVNTMNSEPILKMRFGIGWITILSKYLKLFPPLLIFLWLKLKNLVLALSFYIGICPKDIKGLYHYFVWWGAGLGVKRKKSQTLREFRERLQQSLADLNSPLSLEINRLTAAYEQYCYGGDPAPLSSTEIKDVFQALVKFRKGFNKA